MWWPRPRWKSDIFTRFVLLLLFIITTITTKNSVMADEGQQHCGSSNMSAVVWTTFLCTMLLILAIVAIYFIYCKRREHDWSSLWWKSNSDKNLVLQTSAPVKNHQLKNGGTDNPAFSVDAYNSDCVTKKGLTRVVRVSSSSLSEGSLENELSLKEEDGKKIYMCKHNDGSKDQLVSLRLVFDKGPQQQSRPPASDLSRSLVELSRKYGLHIELETEGEAAPGKPEKCADDSAAKCGKSSLLSTVCGQAQRLWNQRQTVFKGGESGNRGVDAEKDVVDGDVESGRVDAVLAGKAAPPVQSSPCTVTTVSETAEVERPARNHGGSLRYRTLEYGASAADAEAQSSPDSGVQCCTVNPSESVRTQSDKDATAALTVTVDRDVTAVAAAASEKDKTVLQAAAESVKDAVADKDEGVKAEKDKAVPDDKNATVPPLKTVDVDDDDGGSRPLQVTVAKPAVQKNGDEPKHANPPPPPPPRKYSAPVAPPTVPVTRATAAVACTAAAPEPTSVPVAVCAEPTKPSTAAPPKPSTAAPPISEIRVDDDYYWCTTTAMAPPPMSTFGKRPSVEIGAGDGGAVIGSGGAVIGSGAGAAAAETTTAAVIGGGDAVATEKTAAVIGHKEAAAAAAVAALVADDGRDVVVGATTSIEDASLPSFSSDEEEDDEDNNCNNNALAADKSKFPPCVDDTSTMNGTGMVVGKDTSGGNVAKTECNGVLLNNNNNNNNKNKNNIKNICVDVDDAPPSAAEPKSPVTKLPTLRLSLSSPLQSSAAATSCCSSSASSTSSTSPSPTNSSFSNSPIVSKIPVRRQSAGSGLTAVSSPPPPLANGTPKKSIPLPLSRSGSRLAMWSSAN
ncbi:mucin-5AC-like [Aphis gossypii]|uniref:mucin-5AC-like n=1 Tax=Aphis gossypii TaxID=80765 RepID=UPI002158D3F4|nr:mucin-5AC-like [Aphis gossypii]XP_050061821.1 mucin-5AC-like [Aphis gossypii]XP_050061822.1 mucin-5AC-like [Aphis gossypii]XP_050061823.1 mucin-5AC-like [Aphis gossypii]XP_050061824.1 mucin-5AC-like [Aphis gossypii]